MHHPFVAVDDDQGQKKPVDVDFSRPVDVVHYSLGDGRVAGKFHDQARPQLVVTSTMLHTVQLAHIVQQGGSLNRPGIKLYSLLQGQGADFPGNPGHQDAVIYDMPGKAVIFQVMKAFLPGGNFPPGICWIWNWLESINHCLDCGPGVLVVCLPAVNPALPLISLHWGFSMKKCNVHHNES